MTVITPYISEGVQAGQPVALKIQKIRWRTVGTGQLKTLSDYELEVDGRIELPVYKGDLNIHIELADKDVAATSGPCSLQLNSYGDDEAEYSADDDGLTISAQISEKAVQISLSRFPHDNMTECTISGPLDLTAYIEPSNS